MFSKSAMIAIMNAAAQKIEELNDGPNEIADDLYQVVAELEEVDWKQELAEEDQEEQEQSEIDKLLFEARMEGLPAVYIVRDLTCQHHRIYSGFDKNVAEQIYETHCKAGWIVSLETYNTNES